MGQINTGRNPPAPGGLDEGRFPDKSNRYAENVVASLQSRRLLVKSFIVDSNARRRYLLTHNLPTGR